MCWGGGLKRDIWWQWKPTCQVSAIWRVAILKCTCLHDALAFTNKCLCTHQHLLYFAIIRVLCLLLNTLTPLPLVENHVRIVAVRLICKESPFMAKESSSTTAPPPSSYYPIYKQKGAYPSSNVSLLYGRSSSAL